MKKALFAGALFLSASCGQRGGTGTESEHMIRVCIRHNGGEEECRRKYGSSDLSGSPESMVQICIRHNGGEEPCRRKYGASASGAARSSGSSNAEAAQLPASGEKHRAEFTLYTTEDTLMEGGPLDRCGRRLGTLEEYLAGQASYVSLALDSNAFPYGTVVRIPQIEARLNGGKPIEFRIVDTGGAFVNQGRSRVDLCVGDSQDDVYGSRFGWISTATLDYVVVRRGSGRSGDCP